MDLPLKDLYEIFTKNFETLSNSRYKGDYEFRKFRKFLKCKKYIFLIADIFTLMFFILINYKLILDYKKYCCFLIMLLIFIIILEIITFICIQIKFISFSKYFELKKDIGSLINIKWKEWQCKDILFEQPFDLNKNKYKYICFEREEHSEYNLLFLCQYPIGCFGWFGINTENNNLFKEGYHEKKEDTTFCEDKFKSKENEISIPIKEIINNMRKSVYEHEIIAEETKSSKRFTEFHPKLIWGVRIRANVSHKKIAIENINVK